MKYLLAALATVTLFCSTALANAEDDSEWRCGLLELDKVEVEYRSTSEGEIEWRVIVHHDETSQVGVWRLGGTVSTDKQGSTGLRWAPKLFGPDGNEFRVRHGRFSYKTIGPDGKVRWYGATKLAPKKGQAL